MFWKYHPTVKRLLTTNPEAIDDDLIDLLNHMFSVDLQVRPKTIQEVFSHVYFNDVDFTDISHAQQGLQKIIESQK